MNRDYIPKLVQGTGIAPGELVLVHFWGENGDKSWADEIMTAVAACGASPVLLMQSRQVNQALFASAGERCFDSRYFARFEGFDLVLDVFAQPPIALGKQLLPAQMAVYRRYVATLFSVLMKAPRFVQLRLPTAANAREAGIDPADYIARLEHAFRVDCDALRAACAKKAAEMTAHPAFAIATGQGCVLRMDTGGRSWHIDAGDGDIPCGEIYAAPIEEKTEGRIHFPRLHAEGLGDYADAVLTIGRGVVTDCTIAELREKLLSLPPEERTVGEIGLGMNPQVKDLCGVTVLDEKMAGSFHIGLGGNTLFGGRNEARRHTDLVHPGPFNLEG